MANHVFIASSLDGFTATENDGLEWLETFPNPDKSDYGYTQFIQRMDAIVMGRRTFEKVLSFNNWPYTLPVFVLSNHDPHIPKHLLDHVKVVTGDLTELCQQLNQQGFHQLYIDGGQTIQSFLSKDLINDMIITRLPILLGKGICLFGTLNHPLKFEHLNTEVFNNGLIQSHYRR